MTFSGEKVVLSLNMIYECLSLRCGLQLPCRYILTTKYSNTKGAPA